MKSRSRGEGQGFCDDSNKASVIEKRHDMGGAGNGGVTNCPKLTSFKEDPIFDRATVYNRPIEISVRNF